MDLILSRIDAIAEYVIAVSQIFRGLSPLAEPARTGEIKAAVDKQADCQGGNDNGGDAANMRGPVGWE